MNIKWIRLNPLMGFSAMKIEGDIRRVRGGFIYAAASGSRFVPDNSVAEVEFSGARGEDPWAEEVAKYEGKVIEDVARKTEARRKK